MTTDDLLHFTPKPEKTNRDLLKEKLAKYNNVHLTKYTLQQAKKLLDATLLDEAVGPWSDFVILGFIQDMVISIETYSAFGVSFEKYCPTHAPE